MAGKSPISFDPLPRPPSAAVRSTSPSALRWSSGQRHKVTPAPGAMVKMGWWGAGGWGLGAGG